MKFRHTSVTCRRRWLLSRSIFEIEKKNSKKIELEKEMSEPGFWDNPEYAQRVVGEFKDAKNITEQFSELEKDIKDVMELAEMVEAEESEEASMQTEIEEHFHTIEREYRSFRVEVTLSGEYDRLNVFMSIHAGAGGTEACDWTAMLLRMYCRWIESRGWKYSLVDENPDEEAGYKRVMLHITGTYAYGYLKSEIGVHRLVRISPFDAQGKRHTSFAAVDVIPEYEENSDIDIQENDIRIDTYRSSGAGGQHVNVTDSAVRITHIPTGIVVQCQNERSQHKNKSTAMKILKSRLEHLEEIKRDRRMKELYGEKGEIAWGNQIRSYVLTPYTMVRDHRTDLKKGNFQKVLDGDLDDLIYAYLDQNAAL